MRAEPCSQRPLGSDPQGKANRSRVCKPKEKGNLGDLCTTTPFIISIPLTRPVGIESRDHPLNL